MAELTRAAEPFRFYTRLHLTELTGLRAAGLVQLVRLLKSVPGGSIYYHTHRFLQQHQYLSPEPPNDFAYWVREILGEQELGERLASIDIIEYSTIRSLRERIIETIEGYLVVHPEAKMRFPREGGEFHFRKSVSFILPTEHVSYDLREFAEIAETHHHRFHLFSYLRGAAQAGKGDERLLELDRKFFGKQALGSQHRPARPLRLHHGGFTSHHYRFDRKGDRIAMVTLDDYIPIVGESVVEDLRLIAGHLKGKRILNVNSTAVGGGVAEILTRMVPLLRELGLDVHWDVIKGGEEFFEVTKKFHNGLHGGRVDIGEKDFEIFMETSRDNLAQMDTSADIVFIHDPQPIVLVQKRRDNKWIWRCHIDLSDPKQKIWRFLKEFVVKYDAAVFSAPAFSRRLPIRQFLIAPSIDPLSDKNRELPQEAIDGVLAKYGIPRDKPLITQISRFDRLKDPVGVIAAYRLVKEHNDCRLLLAGGTATDDPEGQKVFEEVKEAAQGDPDIHILVMSQNDLEINALQRASTVILQKSLKEGFGLTVSEGLWKGKTGRRLQRRRDPAADQR